MTDTPVYLDNEIANINAALTTLGTRIGAAEAANAGLTTANATLTAAKAELLAQVSSQALIIGQRDATIADLQAQLAARDGIAEITSPATVTQPGATQRFYRATADRSGAWSKGIGGDAANFTLDANTGIYCLNADAAGDGSAQLTRTLPLVFTPSDNTGPVTQAVTVTLAPAAAPSVASFVYDADFSGAANTPLQSLPGWSNVGGSTLLACLDGSGRLTGTQQGDGDGNQAVIYSAPAGGGRATFTIKKDTGGDYNGIGVFGAASDSQNGVGLAIYPRENQIQMFHPAFLKQAGVSNDDVFPSFGSTNAKSNDTFDIVFDTSADGKTLNLSLVGDRTQTLTVDLTGKTSGSKYGFSGHRGMAAFGSGKLLTAFRFEQIATTLAVTSSPARIDFNVDRYALNWGVLRKPSKVQHQVIASNGDALTGWMTGESTVNNDGTITYDASLPDNGKYALRFRPLDDTLCQVQGPYPAPKIGMNLVGTGNNSTEYPFIDRMKSASSWEAGTPTDANDYPIGYPSGVTSISTDFALDRADSGTSQNYVLIYEGTATITTDFGPNVTKNVPGRVEFTGFNGGKFRVTDLTPTDPLRNMHMFRADQEALFNAGEVFNPAFLQRFGMFDTFRFMDWLATNDTTVTDWSQRTVPSRRTWGGGGNVHVPHEIIIALCNKTKVNPWLNWPHRSTDDYVAKMATLYRDTLDPSLVVRLEYSNEVWNNSFQTYNYVAAQAAAKWPGDNTKNGDTWHGYRAAQIGKIARDTFSSQASRIRPVIGTFQSDNHQAQIFNGIALAGLGAARTLFKDFAFANYFGSLVVTYTYPGNRAPVLAMARNGAAGITAAIQALRDNTGITVLNNSIAHNALQYAYLGAYARAEGLSLVAYEGGGAGFTFEPYNTDPNANPPVTTPFTQDEVNELTLWARTVRADPRMGDLERENLAAFRAAGGTLACYFNDVGISSNEGAWGTLPTIYDLHSPTYDALVALASA